jgi:hypothetical protein
MKAFVRVSGLIAIFVLLLSGVLGSLDAAKADRRLTIYVGPHAQEEFVDVEVRDSIRDIKSFIRERTKLRLVDQATDAKLQLLVIRRGHAGSSGAVGVPVAGMLWFAPISKLEVETVLRVRDYEKPIIGVSDRWKDCARHIVLHLKDWVKVNGGQIK